MKVGRVSARCLCLVARARALQRARDMVLAPPVESGAIILLLRSCSLEPWEHHGLPAPVLVELVHHREHQDSAVVCIDAPGPA